MLELEKISSNNICYYKTFEGQFDSDLSCYQSRIYPNKNTELLNWYYIKYIDNYIGSIWIEKDKNNMFAVLGIFIADENYRGKGLGKCAIQKIIEHDAKSMNIKEIHLNVRQENARAILCYSKLGFSETKRYKKDNGIDVISMCYYL